ncbi:MAG: hypothetical protein ACKOC8_07005 [Pirellulales bacterium]
MTPPVGVDAELILHVGAPKTGSSAAQRHFCSQAAVLRRHGIHYPPHRLDTNGVSGGHGDLLARALAAPARAGRRLLGRHLADARRSGCRLLLSAEAAFLQPHAVTAILPTPRFHVVCLLRHPLDAVVSHHNQGVKRHRSRRPLWRLARAILAHRDPVRSLVGDPLLAWLVAAGAERLAVLPYVVAGTTVDTVALLRGWLGLPAAALPTTVNSSYTPGALEFRRLVNHLPPDLIEPIDADLDRWLQAYSDARPAWRPALEDLVDADVSRALDDHFRPAVEQVEKAFRLRLDRRRHRTRLGHADTPADVWKCLATASDLATSIGRAVVATVAATPDRPLPPALTQLHALAQEGSRS